MLRSLILAAVLIGVFSGVSPAADSPVSVVGGRCPGYLDHLRRAQAYLERGQRAAAVAELRRAGSVLDGCVREEGDQALPAAQPGGVTTG